ncbi:SapC family protein [Propionivibrio limicola]|uniref:SapC family protein n=1 Tax=Propionivibrio limicola TaxID=167645 RepID=UPI001292AC2C|nr:SapC family protein [Propionivibrio limicola]
MPDYHPVSRERHANRHWQPSADFGFAAQEAVVPLVAAELARAAMAFAIAFVRQGEHFAPVAVLDFRPGSNLFVAPDGRWLADYVPAAYRGHPFALANTADGKQVLCVDESSPRLQETDGTPILGDDGQPSPDVRNVINFLTQVEQNRQLTQRVCGVLEKHDLIQPWPVRVQSDNGEEKIAGLFRVDEAALNALAPAAFEELRQAGALPVAYCQLLSMQNLQKLAALARQRTQALQQVAQSLTSVLPFSGEDLDLEFLNHGGVIRFGNFI